MHVAGGGSSLFRAVTRRFEPRGGYASLKAAQPRNEMASFVWPDLARRPLHLLWSGCPSINFHPIAAKKPRSREFMFSYAAQSSSGGNLLTLVVLVRPAGDVVEDHRAIRWDRCLRRLDTDVEGRLDELNREALHAQRHARRLALVALGGPKREPNGRAVMHDGHPPIDIREPRRAAEAILADGVLHGVEGAHVVRAAVGLGGVNVESALRAKRLEHVEDFEDAPDARVRVALVIDDREHLRGVPEEEGQEAVGTARSSQLEARSAQRNASRITHHASRMLSSRTGFRQPRRARTFSPLRGRSRVTYVTYVTYVTFPSARPIARTNGLSVEPAFRSSVSWCWLSANAHTQ